MKRILSAIMAATCAASLQAAIQTKTIEYQQGDTTLEGFVAWDDAISGPRPGVLVVHQWMGLTDYEKHRAEMLAQLGYVAFCADIYGKGVRPQNTQEAGALAGKYRNGDRQLLRARSTPVWTHCASNRWSIPNVSPPSVIVSAARPFWNWHVAAWTSAVS